MAVTSGNTQAIEALGARIDKRFDNMQTTLTSIEERVRLLERTEAGCSPIMNTRLSIAEKKIETHADDIATLGESVRALAGASNRLEGILKWLLGIGTAVLIGLLLALMKGEARILFGG